MAKVQKIYVEVNGKHVPAKIYHENRRNVRASFGKNSVILRMPILLTPAQQKEQFAWFKGWVQEQFAKHKNLHTRFFGKNYKDGDVLKVGTREYVLKFDFIDKKTHTANLENGILHLKLSKHDSPVHLQKAIKHLLSRVIANDYKPEITRRVNELNNLFFKMPVKGLKFKYNQSNWGSCSSQGNLNLSTRLLFAPDAVVDYVIIHELAHLIEMNHSNRFWKLVSDAMPDYEEKEKWLKENGHLCQF
ncbi:MAG TPA: M48 family peptidase [Phaeodactylibacter sp.]|nr:M48 family peptidase [Phaeodactylibacter sp.]